jgi:hypothetical protein
MPMDVVRVLDSDLFALSTGDEFKASLSLWCKAWLQVPAASLPDDDRVLAHLSGAGTRWRRVKEMALRGWVKCSDGRLYHPVIAEKAAEAWKHRLAQRERANKRWGNTDSTSSGNATAYPAAHATASATAMQGTGTGTVKCKGKRQVEPSPPVNSKSPKPSLAREKPPEGIDTPELALNYVCNAAGWHPATGDQRLSAIGIINGWLALGCTLELILDGIGQALKRDPSPTRSLKRFDSTILGKRKDQLGGELPTRPADVAAVTGALASSMRTN